MTNEERARYERTHRLGMVGFWFGMAMAMAGGVMYLWKLF